MLKRIVSAGIVCLGLIFMGVSIRPIPEPEINIEPSLRAGASAFPIIDYRTTPVNLIEQSEVDSVIVAEVTSEIEAEIVDEVDEIEITVETEEAVAVYNDELDLLYRTVQAEGYTMGFEGMQYITDAILNLARSRDCSVTAVINSGAYTVVNNGTIWKQQIYDKTIAAVNAEIDGSQLNYDIKYFRTNHFHGFGTPVFHYGNVYFSM